MSKNDFKKAGAFFWIPLPDGQLGYGRLLPSEYVAIYKLRTQQASDDLDFIERHPILYRSHVNDRMFKRWAFIGSRQVTGELAKPDKSYMQSDTDYRDCTIFDTDGNSWAATPEECIGLESSGVWDPEAMEKRIVDFFEGRINGSEVEDRVRLAPGVHEEIAAMLAEERKQRS